LNIDILTIPGNALVAMASKSPRLALSELTTYHEISLIDLLTFGMINTPISDAPVFDADRIVAYVSLWDGYYTTLCAVDGDMARLVYGESNVVVDPDDALEFFRRHWPA